MIRVGRDEFKVCVTFNFLLAIENTSLFWQIVAQQETAKISRASAKVTDMQFGTDEEGVDVGLGCRLSSAPCSVVTSH